MITDVRLVICDIDGTLVKNNRELTLRTKNVIQRLRKHGILFGIASGRPLDELDKKAGLWGFDEPFDVLIGMNGSELWDEVHQHRYDYFKMKKEWLKEVITLMEPFESNCFIYKDGYLLSEKMNEQIIHSAKSSGKEVIVADDISQMYETDNAKIMFRVKEEDMAGIEAYVNQHPSPYYKGFKTQSMLLEFANIHVSKAYALEEYCKMNYFGLENVVSFGDTSNDNDMLKCSGLGVCMCNGSNDTLAIADDITEFSNEEDGFARYMEEHFLLPKGW